MPQEMDRAVRLTHKLGGNIGGNTRINMEGGHAGQCLKTRCCSILWTKSRFRGQKQLRVSQRMAAGDGSHPGTSLPAFSSTSASLEPPQRGCSLEVLRISPWGGFPVGLSLSWREREDLGPERPLD